MSNYSEQKTDKGLVRLWDKHVTIELAARKQLNEVASMPFVKPYVAAMPDTHYGMGATVGSVIPQVGAIIPAAVGVDIGCGMMAVRTNLKAAWIQDNPNMLKEAFELISHAIPHGRSDNGGANDIGAWSEDAVPQDIQEEWKTLLWENPSAFEHCFKKHPKAYNKNAEKQLGTLGTGNHFIELCREIDNNESKVWVVIHSGSRGFGNAIGSYFTKLAFQKCNEKGIELPNRDLGYLTEDDHDYDDYLYLLSTAQAYAWKSRVAMMNNVLGALRISADISGSSAWPNLIHMHHNYTQAYLLPQDNGGFCVNLTRKGAVDASRGKFVIIPGSMGAKTYIARGLGNPDSFDSCSHGAGRAMSRTQALKNFTVADHIKATEGVVCDKTEGVLDETPAAYKDIDAVMESQKDLVSADKALTQMVCIKGISD